MALMGEGRELRLGLSGVRPDGACEKTTTHWPTCRQRNTDALVPLFNKVNKLPLRADTYPTGWVTPEFWGSVLLVLHLELLPPPWW